MQNTMQTKIARAIYLLNHITNPATFRSDDQHAICNRAARKLRRWIRQHATLGKDYAEYSSGRLHML
jgi:hypothetical protein